MIKDIFKILLKILDEKIVDAEDKKHFIEHWDEISDGIIRDGYSDYLDWKETNKIR